MSSKTTKIALLVVCVLLALEYAFAGIPKMMGQDEAVQGFRHAGFSDGFRLFIGAAEVSGALGLLVPRLRFWAATGLSIIMIGALVTHVRAHDTFAKMAPAAISLILLVLTAWTTRHRRAP